MKIQIFLFCFLSLILFSCDNQPQENPSPESQIELAKQVKTEFIRSWEGYKKYAWGHDVLLPLTKNYKDWYEESLHISPIDAYSTMKVMGLDKQAEEVEKYVLDSISWEKDIFVKTFEVNIRILGGLLAMYEYTGNPEILAKTENFGRKMLKAFDSPTGLPYYWFNLKTGETKGSKINIAEAGTYLIEMGVLSYYTKDPVFYQTAKKANQTIFNRRSEIGLIGSEIDVETGEWLNTTSHICAGVDSYYEYLLKAYILFGDKELKPIWEESIAGINTYLADETDSSFWYARVDMNTGEKKMNPISRENPNLIEGSQITLYDAFFPAVLALNGDFKRASKNQNSWDDLWNKYGLEPMVYNYHAGIPTYPVYDLNPEIIESAYYLLHFTKKKIYQDMIEQYWADILKYCRTDIAFASIADVQTMEKKDYMPTFFFAETLKYFYLAFSIPTGEFDLDDYVFNTEAHPFKKASFNKDEVKGRLGLQ